MTVQNRIRAALAALFTTKDIPMTDTTNPPSVAPVPGQPAADPAKPRTLDDVKADLTAQQAAHAAVQEQKAALAAQEKAISDAVAALTAEGRKIIAAIEADFSAVETTVTGGAQSVVGHVVAEAEKVASEVADAL